MTEIEFLKEKGALDKFIFNLKKVGFKDLAEYQSICTSGGFFEDAFMWHPTPEGHDYWYYLNEEYTERYSS